MGMRWRTEKEVVAGKGQFSCGARGCGESRGLATFEVPFGYEETGQKKRALVKVGGLPPLQEPPCMMMLGRMQGVWVQDLNHLTSRTLLCTACRAAMVDVRSIADACRCGCARSMRCS